MTILIMAKSMLTLNKLLKFLGGGPPTFWTGIIKFGLVLTTVQNFAPISEISRLEYKIKHLR